MERRNSAAPRLRGRARSAVSRRRLRPGITVPELVVGIAIIAVLGVVIVTSVADVTAEATSQDIINEVAKDLDDISRGIAFFEPTRSPFSFKQTVGVYPGRLSHLTTAITTGDRNSCGAFYSAPNVAAWTGGYYLRELPPAGFRIAEGFVTQDSLVRTPPNTATQQHGTLAIVIPDVSLANAQALALTVNGDETGTIGTVRYTPTDGSSPVTVSYLTAVGGC